MCLTCSHMQYTTEKWHLIKLLLIPNTSLINDSLSLTSYGYKKFDWYLTV